VVGVVQYFLVLLLQLVVVVDQVVVVVAVHQVRDQAVQEPQDKEIMAVLAHQAHQLMVAEAEAVAVQLDQQELTQQEVLAVLVLRHQLQEPQLYM
jgi:hypothetical protein